MEFSHIPVLLQPCLDGLNIDPAGIYLDGTAGGAGHSREIAKRLTTGRLISLDQDPDAVATAAARLKGLPAQVVQANFRETARVLDELEISFINGALLDLGVSSHQLDDAERGFSYHADAPLDMRMSQQGPTAADLVNTLDREELTRILRDYGEEPYAWQIAGKIVKAREEAPILTTLQFADLIASAMPPAERRITTLTERGEMWEQYNQYKSIHKQLAKVKPEKREQFEQRHSRELILYDAATRYLKELKDSGEAITPKAWQREIDQLAAGKQTDTLAMKSMREDLKAVERLRKTAEQLSRQEQDKSHDREPER